MTRVLIGGRLLVGGGALTAPRLTGRLFFIDPRANPAAPYLGRLFGVRAVLMAFLVCAADGEERERQLRAGVAVDVVDAAAALVAGWRRELRPPAAAAAFAAAVTEAVLGARVVSALKPMRLSAGTAQPQR